MSPASYSSRTFHIPLRSDLPPNFAPVLLKKSRTFIQDIVVEIKKCAPVSDLFLQCYVRVTLPVSLNFLLSMSPPCNRKAAHPCGTVEIKHSAPLSEFHYLQCRLPGTLLVRFISPLSLRVRSWFLRNSLPTMQQKCSASPLLTAISPPPITPPPKITTRSPQCHFISKIKTLYCWASILHSNI
jgi:hypothetical protein